MNGVMESIDDEDIFKMNQHILTDSNQVNNDNAEFNSNYVNTDDEEDDYNQMKQKMNAVRSQKTKSKKRKQSAERKVVSQQEYNQDPNAPDPALSDHFVQDLKTRSKSKSRKRDGSGSLKRHGKSSANRHRGGTGIPQIRP